MALHKSRMITSETRRKTLTSSRTVDDTCSELKLSSVECYVSKNTNIILIQTNKEVSLVLYAVHLTGIWNCPLNHLIELLNYLFRLSITSKQTILSYQTNAETVSSSLPKIELIDIASFVGCDCYNTACS